MKRARIFKIVCIAMTLSLILSLCGIGAFAEECNDIRGRILRLHVLAHSDDEADQALKLQVRDAVVEASVGLLDGVQDKQEAMAIMRRELPRIKAVAQECVFTNGYTYPVDAQLCDMYFTTRVYETGTLPAGVYTALRITIGEGDGHNWWCVVYPSMCLSAATRQGRWSDVLDEQQTDIVEHPEKYQVRLKVVEWAQSLWNAVSDWW